MEPTLQIVRSGRAGYYAGHAPAKRHALRFPIRIPTGPLLRGSVGMRFSGVGYSVACRLGHPCDVTIATDNASARSTPGSNVGAIRGEGATSTVGT